MTPFHPQTEPELRARYPLALDRAYDLDAPLIDQPPPPGEDPDHIFDSPDGLRLIVARERTGGVEQLHVSASAAPDSWLYTKIRAGLLSPQGFAKLAMDRFRAISGDDEPLDLEGSSPGKGVPHWRRSLGKAVSHA